MDARRLLLNPDTPGGSLPQPVAPPAKLPNVAPGVIPTVKPPNAAPDAVPKPKITHIRDMGTASVRHQDSWTRKTNLTGTGATHVRSFHCRLNSESLAIMDEQINKWLDEHPDYEVKFVTQAVGEWQGKIKEPCLMVHVWV